MEKTNEEKLQQYRQQETTKTKSFFGISFSKWKDFFIQDDTKIKVECKTEANRDEKGNIFIHREFYTFRSLWSFLKTEYLFNPINEIKKNPLPLLRPFAYAMIIFFTIKNVQNVFLFAGAIAYDNATPQGSTSTPFSFSHTTAGSNRFLVVGAGYGNATTTNPTYNGVTMTKTLDNQANISVYSYRLYNPASGSNTLTLTPVFANATACGAISFSGADQSDTVDGSQDSSQNSVSSKSVSFTTGLANTIICDLMCIFSNPVETIAIDTGNSQTERINQAQGFARCGMSTRPTTTAGSYTVGWHWTNGRYAQYLIVGVKESQAVSITVNATVQSATFSIPAYTVTATRFVTVSPNVLTATFSIQSATELIDESYTPPQPITATFSIPTYTVIAGDITASVNVQSATFSIPTYTITAERFVTVSPSVQVCTFSIPTYTAIISNTETPSVQELLFSIPSYSVTAISNIDISPSVQTCTFSIPTYTTTAIRNIEISPSLQAMTFSVPSYTITTTRFVTIDPLVVGLILSIPSYQVVGDFWQDQHGRPVPETSWADNLGGGAVSWSDKY